MAEASKGKKRLVKNPETFRERALKAAETSEQLSRGSRVRQASGRAVKPVTGPVGRGLRKLTSLKALRWLRRPLRLIGKVLFPTYFRNSWRELRRVSWPTWRESRRLTFAVLGFAIVFGALIAIVDYGLDKLFRHILLK